MKMLCKSDRHVSSHDVNTPSVMLET